MNRKDLFGLKYFLAFAAITISFYAYSGIVGWRWFNPTSTEKNDPKRTNSHGVFRYFHK